MEGKHILESNAKSIDQLECTIQPHMDQKAHQSMKPT
jgi:hypothetical protein